MIRRTLTMAALGAFTFTAGAWAYGGWAVVTIKDLPDHLEVGKPTTFTFMVRQHGKTPLTGVYPTLEARLGGLLGAAEVTAQAKPTSTTGEYTASLTVPKTGEWRITVNSGWGNSHISLYPIQAVEAGKTVAAITDLQRGEHLFVAKGCVTCHERAGVEGNQTLFDIAPSLTDRPLDPAYLALWLANPAIRPPTRPGNEMPNLGLSKTEIAELTTFVTAKSTAAAITKR